MTRIVCAWIAAAAVGCGGPSAEPSDPDKAKTALVSLLDAWKAGQPADDFRKAYPELTAVEPRWKPNSKLLEYELTGEPKPSGWDVVFTVRLTYQTGDGKKAQEKALYTVSTTPKLVVLRTEPNG